MLIGQRSSEGRQRRNTDRGETYRVWGDVEYPVEYGYSSYGKMVTMDTYRSGTNPSSQETKTFPGYAVASWTSATWPGAGESPDTTTWQYDAASGQMTNKVYADSSHVGYSYTVDGKLSTRTWARSSGGSHVTTYSYDSDTGELTGIDYSDSTPDIAFTYNRMGQQSAVSDAVGGRGFVYNSEFQLESETITNTLSGLTHTLTRSYSDTGYLGRDIGFSLDSDYGVGYEFDTYGRMNAVTHSNFASFAPFVVNYSYLSNSDLISVVSNSYGLASTRSYESDRNLITEVLNEFGTNVISRYAYGNDQLARRTNRIDTGSAISAGATNVFGYNDRSELTSALMTTNGYAYSYDPIGNHESATNNTDGTLSYTANELNQYTEITNGSLKSLCYDPDGSLTNDGEWAYTWDCENHLVCVESANLTNGAKKVESDFDYKGRRIRKTVSEYTNSAWSVVSTNHFLWDQWNPIQEISFSGGTTNTRSFAYGLDISGTLDGAGGIGGLLSMTQGTNVYFYCADGNGNVSELLTDTGEIAAHYVEAKRKSDCRRKYSPFGEIKTSAGTMATENPFRFSSKYYDDEIALLIYELRPVRPKMLGRFLSRDPIAEIVGFYEYTFTLNCPVNLLDMLGLWDVKNVVAIMCRSAKGQDALSTLDQKTVVVSLVDEIRLEGLKKGEKDWEPLPVFTVGLTKGEGDIKNGKAQFRVDVYIDKDISDHLAALTLVHEAVHVGGSRSEFNAHRAEAQFALDYLKIDPDMYSALAAQLPGVFIKNGKIDEDEIKKYLASGPYRDMGYAEYREIVLNAKPLPQSTWRCPACEVILPEPMGN